MWKKGKLKDFIVLQRGHDLTDNDLVDGPYPVVKSSGIDGYHNECKAKAPGVTTGRSGTIGNVFFIEQDFWPHNTSLYVKEFNGNDPKFFYYLIQSLNFDRYFAGTTVPTLNRNDVHKIKIAAPDVPEQRAIAAILTRVDKAIEATEASIRAAKRLKQAAMQNLLTGKLKPDGTWRSEDEFYTDTKFGKVPVGWEVNKLQALCSRKNESFNPLTNLLPEQYIGLEHINSGEFTINGFGRSDDTLSLKSKFTKGNILYGKLRPYLNKVWLAEFDGVCSTECLVLESNQYNTWVYYILQTNRFLNFTNSVTAGTQHPRAGWKDIKSFLIITPQQPDELRTIIKKLETFDILQKSKQAKITKLQRLKKSLMQNLLTGRVRVDVARVEAVLAQAETVAV